MIKHTLHITLPPRQAPSVPALRPIDRGAVNPYTLAEERLWQRLVGSDEATAEHVAAFEAATGKKHDRNYLI